ncbi:hypothetical protein TPAR_07439, partial [Tolypocladium paradoxum]
MSCHVSLVPCRLCVTRRFSHAVSLHAVACLSSRPSVHLPSLCRLRPRLLVLQRLPRRDKGPLDVAPQPGVAHLVLDALEQRARVVLV